MYFSTSLIAKIVYYVRKVCELVVSRLITKIYVRVN